METGEPDLLVDDLHVVLGIAPSPCDDSPKGHTQHLIISTHQHNQTVKLECPRIDYVCSHPLSNSWSIDNWRLSHLMICSNKHSTRFPAHETHVFMIMKCKLTERCSIILSSPVGVDAIEMLSTFLSTDILEESVTNDCWLATSFNLLLTTPSDWFLVAPKTVIDEFL